MPAWAGAAWQAPSASRAVVIAKRENDVIDPGRLSPGMIGSYPNSRTDVSLLRTHNVAISSCCHSFSPFCQSQPLGPLRGFCIPSSGPAAPKPPGLYGDLPLTLAAMLA
jgi:hypothetical protein